MVSCHAETDIQNTREDKEHVQGHILESEAKLQREDALYTPDQLSTMWRLVGSLMLLSLLRTSVFN